VSATDPMAKYATMGTAALRSAYLGLPASSERLKLRGLIRERELRHAAGRFAANCVLDILGGGDIGSWIPRARACLARAEFAKDFGMWESNQGFLEALLEYRADRCDR
jgi:hypothetical protein